MRVHARAVTPWRFAEALVDIYAIRPPELNIMDAVVAMEGNGPSNGRPRRVGKVLAADNAVCLDAAALRLVGKKPESVPHLQIAAARGLGAIDAAAIDLNTALSPVEGFVMPATFVPGIMGVVLNRLLSRWINCIPEVDAAVCKRCGICVDHCPAGAMIMKPGECPQADKNQCISCYCCQEMCPENAIVLSGRMITRLRRSLSEK
jgi:ferredoxin